MLALLFLGTAALALRDAWAGTFSPGESILDFMAGFFVVFAGFKLMDLRGFAQGDLRPGPARSCLWLRLSLRRARLRVCMLVDFEPAWLLWTEAAVMAFKGLGVAIKLARRQQFRCACLGTFLKVPLTKVTLVEDFGMAALAVALLFLR